MSTPAPGLYPGVSEADYAAWDARRSSVLKEARTSARHMREAAMNVEHSGTRATDLGVGVHCAILDPHRFEREYVCALNRGRKTPADRAAHAEFAIEHAGKQVLHWSDFESAMRIRDAVWRKSWAEGLLGGAGVNELAALWVDEETGLRCKARMDRVVSAWRAPGWDADASVVVELKTARDVTPDGWQRAIPRFGYELQAAMQLTGLGVFDPSWIDAGTLEPIPSQFVWIVFEKSPPFEIALRTPSDDLLREGIRRMRHALIVWAEGERSGRWPGYPEAPEIVDVLPWVKRKLGEPGEDLF